MTAVRVALPVSPVTRAYMQGRADATVHVSATIALAPTHAAAFEHASRTAPPATDVAGVVGRTSGRGAPMSGDETCSRSGCSRAASRRTVVLLAPPHRGGGDTRRCGPYCDEHTDRLLGNLMPTYYGEGSPPALRVDTEVKP